MNILITGGAGYIGSHMSHTLMDRKYKFFVIDNLSTGSENLLPQNCRLIKSDIASGEVISNILKQEKIDSIMHFAASISVEESMRYPLKYYDNNTKKTIELLNICKKSRVKNFIFSSTAAVYGNSTSSLLKEDNKCCPINPYGKSKLMCEDIIKDLHQSGIKTIILRYFNVAGADKKLRTGQIIKPATHLISKLCEVALNQNLTFEIFGTDYNTKDGTCIRDYIHITDLIEAHINSLDYINNGGESDVFNVGYGEGFSVKEILFSMERVLNQKFKIKHSNRREGDVPQVVANNKKIISKIKWKPKFNNIEEILSDSYNWEKMKNF